MPNCFCSQEYDAEGSGLIILPYLHLRARAGAHACGPGSREGREGEQWEERAWHPWPGGSRDASRVERAGRMWGGTVNHLMQMGSNQSKNFSARIVLP